jgi:hypothetical protein
MLVKTNFYWIIRERIACEIMDSLNRLKKKKGFGLYYVSGRALRQGMEESPTGQGNDNSKSALTPAVKLLTVGENVAFI